MPNKPKIKPAAKPKPDVVHQEHVEPAETFCKLPEWVDYNPLADFRLTAWESDESTVDAVLTSEEYVILRDHLARLRGFTVPAEAAHA
jgi:hypothetical protein